MRPAENPPADLPDPEPLPSDLVDESVRAE
jgi:hypothetical protein